MLEYAIFKNQPPEKRVKKGRLIEKKLMVSKWVQSIIFMVVVYTNVPLSQNRKRLLAPRQTLALSQRIPLGSKNCGTKKERFEDQILVQNISKTNYYY